MLTYDNEYQWKIKFNLKIKFDLDVTYICRYFFHQTDSTFSTKVINLFAFLLLLDLHVQFVHMHELTHMCKRVSLVKKKTMTPACLLLLMTA